MFDIKATKILTEQEFNSLPYKSLMSYDDYVSYALKMGSTFTVAKAMTLQNAEKVQKDIEDSIQGWYVEKKAAKDVAAKEYDAVRTQYDATRTDKNNAARELNYATNTYGENSSQYNEALQKYKTSTKSEFYAGVELDIARGRYSDTNQNEFKAFLITRLS